MPPIFQTTDEKREAPLGAPSGISARVDKEHSHPGARPLNQRKRAVTPVVKMADRLGCFTGAATATRLTIERPMSSGMTPAPRHLCPLLATSSWLANRSRM